MVLDECVTDRAGYWCPTDDRSDADLAPCITGSEWVALLKVASRDATPDVSDLACLFERLLIEKKDGVLTLTERGRAALGMAA